MKKILAITISVMMLVSALGLAVSADSWKPIDEPCSFEVDLKQANPANVKKDGIIGAGEYEKYVLSTDPDDTDNCGLNICYGSEEYYDMAYEMCKTMEYYFSWDTVNGFNFAVKFKPETIRQELDIKYDDPAKPTDDFCRQTAINFVAYYDLQSPTTDDEMKNMLYYSIAKATDRNQQYIEGHWGQLGPTGHYDPEAGKDYVITYSADGYVTCEWSVPFAKMGVSGAVGSDVFFAVACTSGDPLETEEDIAGNYNKGYSVILGDQGFYVRASDDQRYVTATVNEEMIAGGDNGDQGGDNGNQGGDNGNQGGDNGNQGGDNGNQGGDNGNQGGDNGNQGGDNGNQGGDNGNQGGDNGNQGGDNGNQGGDNGNQGGNNTPSAPQTADVAVIAAVVSAVSAAGYAISKKRR